MVPDIPLRQKRYVEVCRGMEKQIANERSNIVNGLGLRAPITIDIPPNSKKNVLGIFLSRGVHKLKVSDHCR